MKLMTGLSFNNLIEFYQNKHNVRFDNSRINVLRCIFAKGVDISRYVKPKYVPQLLQVISDLAVFNVDIEEFVSDNQLDIGGILDLHSHLLRSKNIDPLDDILQEALCALGPSYVN